jgi:hypothetical protein
MQIKSARRYIEKKTGNAPETDVVIFAGDFNANGPTHIRGSKSYKEQFKDRVSKFGLIQ